MFGELWVEALYSQCGEGNVTIPADFEVPLVDFCMINRVRV